MKLWTAGVQVDNDGVMAMRKDHKRGGRKRKKDANPVDIPFDQDLAQQIFDDDEAGYSSFYLEYIDVHFYSSVTLSLS